MAEEADVLLLPSLHDEAGLAVAEAAAIGLPIVCLDRGGPPVIAGSGVMPGTIDETIEGLREALRSALDSDPSPARLDPATRRVELVRLLRAANLLTADDGLLPVGDGGPATDGAVPRPAAIAPDDSG